MWTLTGQRAFHPMKWGHTTASPESRWERVRRMGAILQCDQARGKELTTPANPCKLYKDWLRTLCCAWGKATRSDAPYTTEKPPPLPVKDTLQGAWGFRGSLLERPRAHSHNIQNHYLPWKIPVFSVIWHWTMKQDLRWEQLLNLGYNV